MYWLTCKALSAYKRSMRIVLWHITSHSHRLPVNSAIDDFVIRNVITICCEIYMHQYCTLLNLKIIVSRNVSVELWYTAHDEFGMPVFWRLRHSMYSRHLNSDLCEFDMLNSRLDTWYSCINAFVIRNVITIIIIKARRRFFRQPYNTGWVYKAPAGPSDTGRSQIWCNM